MTDNRPKCDPCDDECPECREILEGNYDDTGMICPECSYECKFKDDEQKDTSKIEDLWRFPKSQHSGKHRYNLDSGWSDGDEAKARAEELKSEGWLAFAQRFQPHEVGVYRRKPLNTEIMKRERDHDERPSGMIEEAPLLKRLAFKQSDKYFLTLWADWRNPVQHQTIVELVERKDEISVINESYDDSDEAIKRYGEIAKEREVE